MTDKLERLDLEHLTEHLRDLVQFLIKNDPDKPAGENGCTVFDLWRADAINALAALASSSVPEQDSLGEREAIVAWLDDHLKAGACLSLSWIIDAIEAGEHLTRQALEQGSAEGSRATASRQPAGAPSGLSPQAVSGKAAHQAQERGR